MVTCRKAVTLRYRIFALFAALAVAVLSAIAIFFALGSVAHAEESEQNDIAVQAEIAPSHNSVFGADHANSKAFSLSDDEIVYTEVGKYTGSVSYYLRSGTYHLTDDVVLSSSLEMSYSVLEYEGLAEADSLTVNICLHGHSITASKTNAFRAYGKQSVLNVFDCGGDDSKALISSSRGVYIYNSATFNMYGGVICDGAGYEGLSVSGGATFNMYGGAIRNNKGISTDPGGVYVGGTFNMYGGDISNNTTNASCGGAGVLVYGTFNMYGGSITNNVLDCAKANNDAETLSKFYKGAGVYVSGGDFSIRGNVNISGNIRKNGNTQVINNVELSSDSKIAISGVLGANAQIGVTAADGAFTNGYKTYGNTEEPSKYFKYDGGVDSGKKIGYDATEKEAAVLDSNDSGTYKLESAKVIGAAAATVGDTKVTFTVEATLVNTSNSAKKETITEVKEVALAQPLHGGNNNVSFDYTYKGEKKTLAYVVVPAKFRVLLTWSCSGGTQVGQDAYKRDYDGSDIISAISASYVGVDGERVIVKGSSTTEAIKAQDEDGNVVNSTASVGKYYFFLPPSVDYEFEHNLFVVDVVTSEVVENGYDKMTDAEVVSVVGSPMIGDTTLVVKLKLTLKNTKTNKVTYPQRNYTVQLENALVAGENTISFVYKYTDLNGDVQSKSLSVKVTTVKKQVTIKWYYNGSLKKDNKVNHVYDGVDVKSKIVAVFDGVDGTKQNVDGASDLMSIRDASGAEVTSLTNIGVYTLSLKDSANYDFANNLFTYVVVEKLSDISDLIYEEDGETLLGVSSNSTFEDGTKLKVEAVNGLNPDLVGGGEISTAYNVSFIKDSAAVDHAGKLTVNVLIPVALRGKSFKIFNLSGGVATELEYTASGNYASFETSDLTCLIFVETKEVPPITDPIIPTDPTNPGNTGDGHISASIDGSDITWIWVVIAILAAGFIILVAVLIAKAKSKKNK